MKLDHSFNGTNRQFGASFFVFTVEEFRVSSARFGSTISASAVYGDGSITTYFLSELMGETIPAKHPPFP